MWCGKWTRLQALLGVLTVIKADSSTLGLWRFDYGPGYKVHTGMRVHKHVHTHTHTHTHMRKRLSIVNACTYKHTHTHTLHESEVVLQNISVTLWKCHCTDVLLSDVQNLPLAWKRAWHDVGGTNWNVFTIHFQDSVSNIQLFSNQNVKLLFFLSLLFFRAEPNFENQKLELIKSKKKSLTYSPS